MPRYIFSFDQKDSSFPERYRVVSADEDATSLRTSEDLTGTVVDSEAMDFLERMTARFRSNDSVTVEFVDAPDWKFVELRFDPAKAEAAERRPGTP